MVGMKQSGHRPLSAEGLSEGRWVLLDFGEVVVHVFLDEVREYYDLESLWIDAERIELELPVAAAQDGW